nr:A358 [uncultured bacterium]
MPVNAGRLLARNWQHGAEAVQRGCGANEKGHAHGMALSILTLRI